MACSFLFFSWFQNEFQSERVYESLMTKGNTQICPVQLLPGIIRKIKQETIFTQSWKILILCASYRRLLVRRCAWCPAWNETPPSVVKRHWTRTHTQIPFHIIQFSVKYAVFLFGCENTIFFQEDLIKVSNNSMRGSTIKLNNYVEVSFQIILLSAVYHQSPDHKKCNTCYFFHLF